MTHTTKEKTLEQIRDQLNSKLKAKGLQFSKFICCVTCSEFYIRTTSDLREELLCAYKQKDKHVAPCIEVCDEYSPNHDFSYYKHVEEK